MLLSGRHTPPQAWPDCNLGSVSGVWAHPSHPGHHLGPAIALASALASALALSLASAPASAQTLAKTSSLSLMPASGCWVLIQHHTKMKTEAIPSYYLERLRKGSGYQIGWSFGKIPNGLRPPPPPHFWKIILQFFSEKPPLKTLQKGRKFAIKIGLKMTPHYA